MSSQKEAIEKTIKMSFEVIHMYEWLLNLYVLDFFVDDHWSKLPAHWRECLENMGPQDLGKILCGQETKHMLPLSLICYIKTAKVISIPRTPNAKQFDSSKNTSKASDDGNSYLSLVKANEAKLENLFLKHVKLKKRHEVDKMADVVTTMAKRSKCDTTVDFGSGLGHLSRVLAYKHNLHAVAIDSQRIFLDTARRIDIELETSIKKQLPKTAEPEFKRPVHINSSVRSEHELYHTHMPDLDKYGVVGLHPCGDFGPVMLRHFVDCEKGQYICVVGCCYMKLSCGQKGCGYPMSNYVNGMDSALSYSSREIACHAIEVYSERLMKGDYRDLKVHAYRAALERILINMDPNLKHTLIKSVKHTDGMTFESYCRTAVRRLSLRVSGAAIALGYCDVRLWQRVVMLYTLRLVLAPLVESVILLDRMLYLLEHGLSCKIYPVFDPKISARNLIIVGRRR